MRAQDVFVLEVSIWRSVALLLLPYRFDWSSTHRKAVSWLVWWHRFPGLSPRTSHWLLIGLLCLSIFFSFENFGLSGSKRKSREVTGQTYKQLNSLLPMGTVKETAWCLTWMWADMHWIVTTRLPFQQKEYSTISILPSSGPRPAKYSRPLASAC